MLTRGVGTRVVPPVTGLQEREAIRKVEDADLEPAIERNFRKAEPAGTVYHQSPAPNAKVREGRRVRIFVSLGAAQTVMPDLRGLHITEAKNRLRAVGSNQNVRGGLTLDMISRTSHPSMAADHVISHFPSPGQSVTIGDRVQLLISTGLPKNTSIVPNVIGKSQEEAEQELTAAGLVVQRVLRESSSGESGRVLRIQPEAGTPINEGDWVSLVVSTPRIGARSGQPRMILIRYVVPLVMERLPFILVLADREGSRNIYSGTPNPGQVLDFAERVVGDAELKVYVDGILSKTTSYATRQ